MKDKGSFCAIWSLIGITNSGLYAVIGAAVVGLRKTKSNWIATALDPDHNLKLSIGAKSW